MSAILRKYGIATTVTIPLILKNSNFAAAGDWTPATGDVKASKDDGAVASVGTLPVNVGGTGSVLWKFTFSATEMQAARVVCQCVDQTSPKAIADQAIILDTYGHASAQHAIDLDDGVRAGLTALPNAAAEAAGGLYTRGTGSGQLRQDANGRADANCVAGDGSSPWAGEVSTVVNASLVTYGLDHLVSTSVTGTDIANNSIIARLASKSATADWDTFANTTDSLQAIADVGHVISVTRILGTAITETNAGDLAKNFSQLFDVNPTSQKNINDLAGHRRRSNRPAGVSR